MLYAQGEEILDGRPHLPPATEMDTPQSAQSRTASSSPPESPKQQWASPFAVQASQPAFGANPPPADFPRLTVRTSSGKGCPRSREPSNRRASAERMSTSAATTPPRGSPRRNSTSPRQSHSPTSPRLASAGPSSSPEYTVCRICELQVMPEPDWGLASCSVLQAFRYHIASLAWPCTCDDHARFMPGSVYLDAACSKAASTVS